MDMGKIWRVLSSGKIEGIVKTKYLDSRLFDSCSVPWGNDVS